MDAPFPCCTCLSWVFGKTRVQETVRNAANSLSQFFKHATAKPKLSVYDVFSVTGRWKRSRPDHAEGSARPAKDPLDGEDQQGSLLCLLRRTQVAESSTNWQSDSRTFTTASVHQPVVPQNHDVSRRTDQSVIEAAKCMCHKLLGEASDDLERHAKVSLPRPHGTNVDVFVPRRRVRSL